MPTEWILEGFFTNEFTALKVYKVIKFALAIFIINCSVLVSSAQVNYKILLIPFEPKMLMSEIGRAVNANTGMSYDKIADALRTQMDLALYKGLKQSYTTISLLQNSKKTDTTLAYIYSSIGYKYELIPGKDSLHENHSEFDSTLQNKHFIHNGELQVPMDYSKRFMNVSVSNRNLLSWLGAKYGCNTFIFINELDVRDVSNPTDDLTQSNFRRQITAHYSILNTQYSYLSQGILTTYFPYTENNPTEIGDKYFSVIAQQMLNKLNNIQHR